MCLIIHRPENIGIPARFIDNGLEANPDGWGIVSSLGNKLHVSRGLSAKSFRKALAKHDSRECLIHFRYATHGSANVQNCHPFAILGGDYAIVHNGVMNVDIPKGSDRSDTYHFAEDVLAPILAENPALFGCEQFADEIGRTIGKGNKVLVMRRDGAIMSINRDQGVDSEGLWLSNAYSVASPTWFSRDTRTIGTLEDLAEMDYHQIVEFLEEYPEETADMIQTHFASLSSFRDYR